MANADRIIELLHEAKARPAGAERARFLDEACGNDSALKEQIASLLKADADEGESDFLKINQILRPTILPTEKPGDRIGRYKLLEQIGEGGCGVVYMAEQEEPVRRRVALKVIKLGMDTKQVIARFEAERQALALMDHPNIAKVLDGGATDTGRPFFVMELVRGIKITDYCDQNNLSTNERLELFTQVCQAIQHAHQKGIIHRDIKPSNILVTQHDDVAVPKVIDFGIAKATIGQLTDKTVFTAFAQFIGTPAYMSPEQAQMSGLDIDTRADIYSLGVLLYELLTGNTPFNAKELLAAGMDEMRRKIREDEPAKPSTCLSTMQAMDLTTVARRRHIEPPKLIHLIRGDLDWLVMKCLEKDRTRRYETANALAMDLQRHLNNEPVVACPPTNLYRFQKLVRRNKLAFAAASAVVAALVLGMVVSTWQAVRATRAENVQRELRQQAQANEQKAQQAQANEANMRQQAEANAKKAASEAAKSQQVAQFLKDMLKGVNPSVALGRDATMLRGILDKTAERVGKDLKEEPAVEAELRSIIGNTYHGLGDFAKAEAMHREALRLRKALFGETNEFVAASLSDLADAVRDGHNSAEAETMQREALAIRRILFGNEHPDVAKSLASLADALTDNGKLAEAEAMQRETLTMQRKLLGNENPDVAESLNNLSRVLWLEGKLAEAEVIARQALAVGKKLAGSENPSLATSLMRLAMVLQSEGKLAEAERLFREGLAMRTKVLGKDHSHVRSAHNGLVTVLRTQGKLAEVETLCREELAARRKLLGNEHPDVARALYDLAVFLREQGKLPEAEPLFREAQELWRQHPDPAIGRAKKAVEADPQNTHRWHDLGVSFFNSGEWQAAIAAFEKCNQLGSSAWQWFFMAMAHWQLDNQDEARNWFYESIGWMDDVQEIQLRERQAEAAALLGLPDPWDRSGKASTYFKQGNAHEQQGEMEKAREAYGQVIGLYETLVADFPMVPAYRMKLVDLLTRTGRQQEIEKVYRQAESVIREALEVRRKLLGNEHPDVAATLHDLAVLPRDQGKLPEAEPLFREALAMKKKLFGNVHREVDHALVSLAEMLQQESKLAEAESVWREELAMERKLSGDEHPFVATSLDKLAGVLREQGKPVEAEAVYREALALRRKLPADDLQLAAALAELTRTLLAAQKFAEAEPPARECLAIREKKLPDNWQTFNARSMLGGSLLGQNNYAEAEPLLLSGYEGMKQREDKIPAVGKSRVKETLQRLVQLYEATGQSEKAAEWNRKLAEFDQAEAGKKIAAPKP